MPHGSIRRFVRPVPPRFVVALLCASIVFVAGAVFTPTVSLAAETARAAACNVNLRTSPSTTAGTRAMIKTGARVIVAQTVSGGSWKTTCSGRPVAGHTWFKISIVNGKSVKSLYGTSYLYAAAGLFKPIQLYAAC